MLTPSQIAEMAEKIYPTAPIKIKPYCKGFTDAMELMSKEWVSVEEYNLLKQQLNNVRDTATQYIRKQEYNKHYLPHLYNARVFTGSVILEIANDFKALVLPLPEPPVLTKDKKI